MANTFQYPDWVAMDVLRWLSNSSYTLQFANTRANKEYTKPFPVGETVRIKFPQQWTVRDGLQFQPQAINRKYTTTTLDQVFGIDYQYDDLEAALKMERSKAEINDNYLRPLGAQLASEIDSRFVKFAYQNTPNIAGVLGTTPTAVSTYQRARTIMNELSCPKTGERGMIVSPQMQETLIANTNTIFNPTSEISRQYREGSVGKAGGFDWYESVQLYSHTAGTWASTVSVNGALQSGSSLTITATAGDTFKQGDVFSLNAVNAVNPLTRRSTGRAKTFTITQDLTAAGGGTDVIYFYPPINGPDGGSVTQYQNVDALPLDGAALTLFPGTSSPNGKAGVNGLALHPDAFAIVSTELELPEAVEQKAYQRDPDSGIAIRMVKAWDPVHSMMVYRCDVVLGFGILRAENCAVRVLSLQ